MQPSPTSVRRQNFPVFAAETPSDSLACSCLLPGQLLPRAPIRDFDLRGSRPGAVFCVWAVWWWFVLNEVSCSERKSSRHTVDTAAPPAASAYLKKHFHVCVTPRGNSAPLDGRFHSPSPALSPHQGLQLCRVP